MSESGPDSGAAGTDRRSDRTSGLPPIVPADHDDDQRTTTALPRPAEPPQDRPPFDPRYSSPAARPTTALPRTPSGGSHPVAPPPSGFVSGYRDDNPSARNRSAGGRDAGRSATGQSGYGPAGESGAGYAGAGYSGTGYPGAGNSGTGYTGPGYTGPGYTGPGYTGASHGGAGYGGAGYGGAGYAAPADNGPGHTVAPAPGGRGEQHQPHSDQAPVGPSWAPQHPYRPDPPAGFLTDADHRERRPRDGQQQQDYRYRDHPRPDYPPPDDGPRDPPHSYQHHDQPQGHQQRDYRPPEYQPHDYQPDDDARYRSPHDYSTGPDHPAERGHDDPAYRRPAPRGSHLPPYSEPLAAGASTPKPAVPPGMRSPRKLTVTRVAALRSRELTSRGVQLFHRATTADGADKSGLTSLTYAVMANYAVDAALAVALAGTLFFAAATAESTGRVLLYLVITVAPFAVIAPFIGPMLDRLQSGRRLALALSSFGRALLAVLMAFNFSHFNPWVIYPCALGNLVLSKAFGVLKAALTPRVLPAQITLVKTNSRLTTFGMIAGGVAGVVAAGLSKIAGSPGALFLTAACAIAGGVLCLRIPAWVESTEGEVPVKEVGSGTRAKGFPQIVTATLWANSMIRVETGFLALFIAFVVKSQYPSPQHSAFTQLLLLGVVGGAAGVGGFVGNTMGARLTLSAPETISIFALAGVLISTVVAVLVPGLTTAAIVGFVGSTASALAKVSLDSVIQHHLPEESRASAFGKSESVLQLGWVFGGVVGLLLGGVWTFGHDSVYAIGFGTITLLLVIGLVQSYLVRSGRTMVPKIGGRFAARAGGRKSRRSSSGGRSDTRGRGDTDRLRRPPPDATVHLPTVDGPPRPRPRKAGDDR